MLNSVAHKSSSEGTFWTKRLSVTIVACGMLRINLYFMKGKDMILGNFLSQQKNDNSDPSEIMPISFNAYNILEENRNFGMHKRNEGKFLIETCSQAKTSGTTLLEVHRIRKKLDPNLRPEKQHALPKKEKQKSCI